MTDPRLDSMMLQNISLKWLHKQFFEVRDFFARIENRVPKELQERFYFKIQRQRIFSGVKLYHKETLVRVHKFHVTTVNFHNYGYFIFYLGLTELNRVFPTQRKCSMKMFLFS